MTMSDFPFLVLSWVTGVALGTLFFFGLWWTIRLAVSAETPALWFTVSLALRLGLVLLGFYFVSGEHWERLLSCLFGFITMRFVVQRLTRLNRETETRKVEFSSHAP